MKYKIIIWIKKNKNKIREKTKIKLNFRVILKNFILLKNFYVYNTMKIKKQKQMWRKIKIKNFLYKKQKWN